MDTSTLLHVFLLVILGALWKKSTGNIQNFLTRVEKCPSSQAKWEEKAQQAKCTEGKTYHCVLSVQKYLYEGCMYPDNITGSQCPQVRGIDGDFDFEHVNFNCSSGLCPKAGLKYRSDQLYKYPGCLGIIQIESTTTTTSTNTVKDQTLKSDLGSNKHIPDPSTQFRDVMIGVLCGVFAVIGILFLGCFLWRKKTSSQTMGTNTQNMSKVSNGDLQPSAYIPVPPSEPLLNKPEETNETSTCREPNGVVVPDTSVPQTEQSNGRDRSDGAPLDMDYHSDESGGRDDDAVPDTQSIGEPNAPTGSGGNHGPTIKIYNGPVIKTLISVDTVNVGNLQAGDGTNVIQHQTERADAKEAATNTDRDDQ